MSTESQRSEHPNIRDVLRPLVEQQQRSEQQFEDSPWRKWTPEYVDCRLLKQAVVPWKDVCAVAAAHNAAVKEAYEKGFTDGKQAS